MRSLKTCWLAPSAHGTPTSKLDMAQLGTNSSTFCNSQKCPGALVALGPRHTRAKRAKGTGKSGNGGVLWLVRASPPPNKVCGPFMWSLYVQLNGHNARLVLYLITYIKNGKIRRHASQWDWIVGSWFRHHLTRFDYEHDWEGLCDCFDFLYWNNHVYIWILEFGMLIFVICNH